MDLLMKKPIKVGGQFSGVGAFDQALIRLGIKYENIYQAEWDKYARQTYLSNYEHPEYYVEDVYDTPVKAITEKHGSLDIAMFSPPCQSFSIAGKREGENSDKGILFYNSLEFITKNKPKFFIFENVKGLLSDNKGITFQNWCALLGGKSINGNANLFSYNNSVPYHIYWQVLNAKDYNIPQNRERVFIVGIREDSDNKYQFPKKERLTKKLKDILEENVDSKYYLSEKTISYVLKRENVYTDFNPEISRTVCSQYAQSSNGSFIKLECKFGFDTCCNLGLLCSDCEEGCNYEMLETEPNILEVGTWRTFKDNYGFRPTENNNCPTILARAREDGSGQVVLKTNHKIRRLTPLECFRAMDFNEDFKWNVSPSQAYKQAGNSICVGVLAKIIQNLPL